MRLEVQVVLPGIICIWRPLTPTERKLTRKPLLIFLAKELKHQVNILPLVVAADLPEDLPAGADREEVPAEAAVEVPVGARRVEGEQRGLPPHRREAEDLRRGADLPVGLPAV